MEKKPFPKPDWHVLPKEGCIGVEARVCLVDNRSVVAILRLGERSHTDIHPAPYDIHVLCTEGAGFAMSGGKVTALSSGESVLWPKGEEHNIYTDSSSMTTIMVEHVHQLHNSSD